MAKEIVKTLRSITHHLNEKMVDIAWSVDTYYDGELLASEKLCGAYPVLPNGELFDPGKTAEGVCIADLLGQAGADSQANLKAAKDDCESHRMRAELAEENAAALLADKTALTAENDALKAAFAKLLEDANAVLNEKNEIHSAAMSIEAELNQAKSVLALKDATIESLQAAKQAAKGEE